MKKSIYIILALLLFIIGTSFVSPTKKNISPKHYEKPVNIADTFPVPPQKPGMLFYVQRTHNTNTIVYELNYTKDSMLNETEPIKIYWIRYADDGSIKELSYIQRKYAYGLTSFCIDNQKKTFKVNFVSYKKRDIYLIKTNTEKKYRACMNINNKPAYIDKIFAKIDGGTFWLPHITYVEIFGKDVSNNKPVSEKIIP